MAKLKQFLTESELTDDIKGAYTKQSDNRYKLNDLSDDHSLVVAQTEVNKKANEKQTQIDTLTAEKGNLERERDEFKNKAIPPGFRAVKKETAEIGEIAEQNGLTKESIPAINQELSQLKSEKTQNAEREIKTKAAKVAGVKNLDDFFERKATDTLNIVVEKEGDKERFYHVTKDAEGKEVKTLFDKDYISKAEGYKSGLAALFGGENNQWVDQESGDFDSGNEYDNYRKEVVAEKKNVQPRDNQSVLAALNGQAVSK